MELQGPNLRCKVYIRMVEGARSSEQYAPLLRSAFSVDRIFAGE